MREFDIHVVLVRTIYESNIGATSRAMANMGFSKLILVSPQCEIGYPAQQAAATGQFALQNRQTFSSWNEFYDAHPNGIRICLTARDGKGRQVRDLKEALTWIKTEDPQFQKSAEAAVPVYLIFGPEDWGLSAEDLNMTHFACSIPTYGDNNSFNLAQATLLALFILRDSWGGKRSLLEGQQPKRKPTEESVFPEQALRTWLEEMGFDTSDRRVSVFTVLKRMLLHNIPSTKELRILETVLFQGIRKLREYNALRKELGLPAIDPKEKIKS